MDVTVRAYASLQGTLGQKEVTVTVEDEATARELLRALVDEYPSATADLFQDGEVDQRIRLHRNAVVLTDMEASLADGDVVSIMPLIAGG